MTVWCTETSSEGFMHSVQQTHVLPVLHIKPGHLNTPYKIFILYMRAQPPSPSGCPKRTVSKKFRLKTCTYFLFLLVLRSVLSISCSGGRVRVVPWNRQTNGSSRYWGRPVVSIDRWYTEPATKELNSLSFTFIRCCNCPPAVRLEVPSCSGLKLIFQNHPL